MHGDELTRLHLEPGYFQIGTVDHQVNVKRNAGHLPQPGAKIRSQCKIRNELPVHNIYVQIFNAAFFKLAYRLG